MPIALGLAAAALALAAFFNFAQSAGQADLVRNVLLDRAADDMTWAFALAGLAVLISNVQKVLAALEKMAMRTDLLRTQDADPDNAA
jgi:hypothetical protein